jgi:hypothetical protein
VPNYSETTPEIIADTTNVYEKNEETKIKEQEGGDSEVVSDSKPEDLNQNQDPEKPTYSLNNFSI